MDAPTCSDYSADTTYSANPADVSTNSAYSRS